MSKSKYILVSFILSCIAFLVSCDDQDKEITDLNLSAVLTPYKLSTQLSNITTLTFAWEGWQNADEYEIQIFEIKALDTDEIPVLEEGSVPVIEGKVATSPFITSDLSGSTTYYVRVRALSETLDTSGWAFTTCKTSFKSIILAQEAGDTDTKSLIVRFTPNSKATRIVVSNTSGTVQEIALETGSDEIVNGIVTIENLTSDTEYTIKIYNETVLLGETKMATMVEGATIVNAGDDLQAILDAAEAGQAFLLREGVYIPVNSEGENILYISKPVVIMGKLGEEPTIKTSINITSETGDTGLTLSNLILDGQNTCENVIELKTETQNYGVIKMSAVVVKDYKKGLVIASSSIKSIVDGIIIENSIFTNILCDGSDAIDFRSSFLQILSITNSTFNSVAPNRGFVRLDDASSSFAGRTTAVNIDHNTFYNMSNSGSGMLYIRFTSNTITFEDNIVANSTGFFSDQSKTAKPTFSGNIYYEAPTFMEGKRHVDTNGLVENPQFAAPATGDFTVGNTSITAGDPRWIK